MSTDSHGANRGGALPEHDTVSFETSDIKARSIYIYLAALAFL